MEQNIDFSTIDDIVIGSRLVSRYDHDRSWNDPVIVLEQVRFKELFPEKHKPFSSYKDAYDILSLAVLQTKDMLLDYAKNEYPVDQILVTEQLLRIYAAETAMDLIEQHYL